MNIILYLFLAYQILINSFNNETIKIIGVGDMMIGTNYPNNSYLPKNNGNNILKNVSATIREADIAFGNLEGTILSKEGEVKKCGDPKKC